jgi:hypothetical protein
MPEHKEDRQYPGQEGGIIGDLLLLSFISTPCVAGLENIEDI